MSEQTDERTFALHVAFARAHGIPKGEYTTFTSGFTGGGAASANVTGMTSATAGGE